MPGGADAVETEALEEGHEYFFCELVLARCFQEGSQILPLFDFRN